MKMNLENSVIWIMLTIKDIKVIKMEFIDVINKRYSVRGYLDKEVEKEKL